MDAGEEKETQVKEAVYNHSLTFIRKVRRLAMVQTSSSNPNGRNYPTKLSSETAVLTSIASTGFYSRNLKRFSCIRHLIFPAVGFIYLSYLFDASLEPEQASAC